MVLLALLLACGDKDSDSGGSAADGGAVSDGGASSDGGTADGGTADGGAADGGTEDGGAQADCDTLSWYEGDLALDSQTALDPFCDSYNAVAGSLYVDVGTTEDPITELDGIGCLCQVAGDLVITGDSGQEPPPELPAPPHVTGDIELGILQRVGGDLVLSHHPGLTYVEGMRGLAEVGGDIRLEHNPELQVVSFYALQQLGGTVSVRDMDKFLILRLPEATSIGGVELGATGDAQTLYFLVELKLDSVTTITGDLRLFGPRNLASLSAPLLQSLGGTLQLEGSCITDLALPELSSVGALRLVGNCGLLDLDGLAALTSITGQDSDGTSLELSGSDHLDEGELTAFLSQLSSTGTGTSETAAATPCADTIALYDEGHCG